MAGGLGFEPRFSESESDVLPLNYPPSNSGRNYIALALSFFNQIKVLRKVSDARAQRAQQVPNATALPLCFLVSMSVQIAIPAHREQNDHKLVDFKK